MKVLGRLGLPGLLLAVALMLASCGGNAGSSGEGQDDDMRGMNHGGSAQEETSGGGMSGMDMDEKTGGMQGMGDMNHGSISTEEAARKMVAPNGKYSDAAFVDAMVPHHEGAVEMAQVGLENAGHEEIRRLSRDIIDAQRAEIELFGRIRGELEGEASMEMSEEEMEGMMGNMDAGKLAKERPFDRAFIDAMIPHHESAIAMANVALEESRNQEIRRIAEGIVSAQKREIEQMRRWRQEWYPEG